MRVNATRRAILVVPLELHGHGRRPLHCIASQRDHQAPLCITVKANAVPLHAAIFVPIPLGQNERFEALSARSDA